MANHAHPALSGEARPVRSAGEAPLPPRVSVIIVNTNELHHLTRCLPSVFGQAYANWEVLIVDNGSTDGSLDYVSREFPSAVVVRNGANLGYAGANNVGFRHATGEYLAVLNPDTEVDPNWLTELVAALDAHPTAGLATPKIVMMDDPAHLNTCGNEITFTGLTFCRGLDEPADAFDRLEPVSAVSGAAFLVRRRVLEEIGPFDESMFIYYEDTDLSLRAMLAGYACLYVPTAVVHHKYVFKFTPRKAFMQERNRYVALCKTLRWRTLAVMLPSLLLSEAVAWGYAGLQGPEHALGKLRSYLWLATHVGEILRARRRAQKLRRVGDRAIVRRFGYRLRLARTTNPVAARVIEHAINPLAFALGRMTRAVVTW